MPDLYPISKKILFKLDAETAHHLTLKGMNLAHSLGVLRGVTGSPGVAEGETVSVMGLTFPNKVGLAAGLDKGGTAVDAFGQLGFGHIEVGTVTPRPQPGNPAPRLFRLIEHEAIINRMGFNNPGTEGLLRNLERSTSTGRRFQGVLGINIGKNFDTPNENANDDYLKAFEAVYHRADYITANLSSPNTKGLRDLQSAETCRGLIEVLQQKREQLIDTNDGRRVPIVIKIAPDLTEEAVKALGAVFSETKIDGVITTNTTISRKSVAGHALADEAGGLSGAPLTGHSTEVLSWLRSAMDDGIPIIASGGVMSADDARAKLDAGAALVQVYTGLIYRGPALVREIAKL
ncbi:MAG: quinone-dependent dihydroorotate dehydrogenase [Verrucomicrobiales bacterium]|nr:quinone-dependent dihydroorotate dehydrogenase [Verrucomicrobiales bacterium]